MSNLQYYGYPIVLILFSLIALTPPAFSEVIELYTVENSYTLNDNITFLGKVNHGDSGLVTIVIRDSNDEFVLLAHATTESDYSFKKIIEINDKFKGIGVYNATGFILNMTAGTTTQFEVLKKEMTDSHIPEESTHETIPDNEYYEPTNNQTTQIISSKTNIDFVDQQKDPIYYVERYYNEPEYKAWFDRNYPEYTIEEAVGYNPQTKVILDFVDPQKDPIYYVERYYNEPEYKAWFDRNYPEYTIEEAVGYHDESVNGHTETTSIKNVIPNAEATLISKSDGVEHTSNELPQFILAISGLVILFGATYGVKRKVDHNSKQISINRNTIRNRIIKPIMGSDPLEILKTRLAKGEITLNEYNELREKLEN